MKNCKRSAQTVLFGALMIISYLDCRAQQKNDVTPIDLKISKTVFLSFAGVHQNATEQKVNSYSEGAAWIYGECFQDLSNSGRFTLLRQPSSADLVLEIRLEDVTQPSPSFRGDTMYATSDPIVFLRILDRKTGVLLWTLSEHVEHSLRQADRDRNLKKAVNDLVADLTALTQPTQSP